MRRPSPISARSSDICADPARWRHLRTQADPPPGAARAGPLQHRDHPHGVRRPMAALEELGRSLAYREVLATAHPSVFSVPVGPGDEPRRDRPRSSTRRSRTARRWSRSSGRSMCWRSWSAPGPSDTRFRAALGRSWNVLGFIRDEARENLQALPAFEHAVKEATRSMEEAPEVDQYRFNAIYTLENLGEQFVNLGRPAEGFPSYRRAIAAEAGAARRASGRPGPDPRPGEGPVDASGPSCDTPASRPRRGRRWPGPARCSPPSPTPRPRTPRSRPSSARSSTERPWPWPTRAGPPRRSRSSGAPSRP